MARPRNFDTETLLAQLLVIFLENGWQQTSMRLLESSTGVKQVSLYNAFGNKEELFLTAFDHWAKQAAETQDHYMKGKGVEGIEGFVKAIVGEKSPLPMPQCGCLAVNTALVADSAGPAIRKRVQEYRDGMHERIRNALAFSKKHHGFELSGSLDQCAEFILSAIWGIFVTIRLSSTDPSVGRPAANALVQTIRQWQK